MTNIVDELKEELFELAAKKNIGIRFTQTNHGNFACTSRVYIFPSDNVPTNGNSDSVINSWDFSQAQTAGSTKRCVRYSVYEDVKNTLLAF